MRVFTFSQWQYEWEHSRFSSTSLPLGDVFTCQICDEEKGVMYVLAEVREDVEGLIDTDDGQRCGECLAQTLTEQSWDVNRG